MKGTSGVTGAGPIFHDVMLAAVAGLPPREFTRPGGIVDRVICRLSGKLPTALCPQVMTEHFIAGTEPRERDDLYRSVRIDTRNGLLASDACPPRFVTAKTVIDFPPELHEWARERGIELPPRKGSPLCQPASIDQEKQELIISHPRNGDHFRLDPLVPDDRERIFFEAALQGSDASVEWYLSGERIGSATEPPYRYVWIPKTGIWTIEARAGARSTKVNFQISEKH